MSVPLRRIMPARPAQIRSKKRPRELAPGSPCTPPALCYNSVARPCKKEAVFMDDRWIARGFLAVLAVGAFVNLLIIAGVV